MNFFEKLQQIAEEDVKLPDTLKEIILVNNLLPATIQKWTKLYTKQRFIVATLKTNLNEVYGEKFKYYIGNSDRVIKYVVVMSSLIILFLIIELLFSLLKEKFILESENTLRKEIFKRFVFVANCRISIKYLIKSIITSNLIQYALFLEDIKKYNNGAIK